MKYFYFVRYSLSFFEEILFSNSDSHESPEKFEIFAITGIIPIYDPSSSSISLLRIIFLKFKLNPIKIPNE